MSHSVNHTELVERSTDRNLPPMLHDFHSPVHVNPSPLYPELHAHVKLPTVLVQLASALQPPLFASHSSINAASQINQRNYIVINSS